MRMFGQWTVLGPERRDSQNRRQLRVVCSCGNIAYRDAYALRKGATKSCGHDAIEKMRLSRLKHGQCRRGKNKSRVYQIYRSMLQRCNYDGSGSYERYGAKGIRVEWSSFEDFYRDMGEPPSGKQIDRIDGTKNYCKENCRWVTPSENSKNRKSTRWITISGKTLCLKDHLAVYDNSTTTFYQRLSRGWSVESAITTPPRKFRRRVEAAPSQTS